jgi:hypothetical protein
MRNAHLLAGKTWDQFDWSRLPLHVTQQFETLRRGDFLDRQDNLLVFGRPGSGKTMLLNALGDQLVKQGRAVCFSTCQMLVQELLRAKRDLRLERVIKKLHRFEALIIDDLGYVQQSREEMEVLFTLLSERYERGSILVSSNLPFSKWEQIFKDPMTTAAAMANIHVPDHAGEDSISFLPVLKGSESGLRTDLVSHSFDGRFAVRKGDWKLIFAPGSGAWGAPRDPQAAAKGMPPVQLYNMKTDPSETTNLQADYPSAVWHLTQVLEQHINLGRSHG